MLLPRRADLAQPMRARVCTRAQQAATARLNVPIDYGSTSILSHTASSALSNAELPSAVRGGTTKRMNLFQAINSALGHALRTDPRVILFGEDVAFGGVFRCSMNLATEFGDARVFNTPLTEQGIVGFGIGAAMEGLRPVAEVQFADYVYPAFDQLVNEAAKCRYRAGNLADSMGCGGLVVRMPCGAVGHGGLYHSQSPEALFTHIPGLRVVIPRSPIQAKGLLLAAIECNDPVVFLEPKIIYRAAVEHVPEEPFTLPLSKAEVLKEGSNLTLISYGTPLYLCRAALDAIEKETGASVELIDLRTIYPWDRPTVLDSVKKTGRCVIVHESMVNAGVGAEVAATIQQGAFLSLEAPVRRVAGWSTHAGLAFEKFNIPDTVRIYDAIKQTLEF
ncbi:thiamine diphosphate-binding protein [Piedraia hortae CBS 480.64]|uniref:3-methyl-2-oxobutanoate dehydrogenase (2-methylpropanoyl-transferring) n=1 Tax=Piedraia hortae CBS 480.64 TaxID=1314780 RepID=A0A6A7BR29_9PEZI|nr:thiamine diphosphate-binding protein [Piedraia hortae CBS 480.64]